MRSFLDCGRGVFDGMTRAAPRPRPAASAAPPPLAAVAPPGWFADPGARQPPRDRAAVLILRIHVLQSLINARFALDPLVPSLVRLIRPPMLGRWLRHRLWHRLQRSWPRRRPGAVASPSAFSCSAPFCSAPSRLEPLWLRHPSSLAEYGCAMALRQAAAAKPGSPKLLCPEVLDTRWSQPYNPARTSKTTAYRCQPYSPIDGARVGEALLPLL
jgi:hypothetical protein